MYIKSVLHVQNCCFACFTNGFFILFKKSLFLSLLLVPPRLIVIGVPRTFLVAACGFRAKALLASLVPLSGLFWYRLVVVLSYHKHPLFYRNLYSTAPVNVFKG